MATVEITTENFNDTVDNNEIVILDFWAAWCGPCKSFAPTFEAASETHPDVVFGKIDTEAQSTLASQFQIRSIPTLVVFREKVVMYSSAGVLSAGQLDELVGKVREVDMAQVHEEIRQNQQNKA